MGVFEVINHADGRRLYNTLTTLAWMLDTISPQHHWKKRLKELLTRHGIDPRPMGFAKAWQETPIWRDATTINEVTL